MIRPLRRAHAVIWIALAAILAAGLAVSLRARRAIPVEVALPSVLHEP